MQPTRYEATEDAKVRALANNGLGVAYLGVVPTAPGLADTPRGWRGQVVTFDDNGGPVEFLVSTEKRSRDAELNDRLLSEHLERYDNIPRLYELLEAEHGIRVDELVDESEFLRIFPY